MLYARIVNFLTRGKHILDRNILLRGERGGGIVYPATFYWSACTKPGKWAVIYFCDMGIDIASFYGINIWYKNCSNSVVLFVFHLITLCT
jgi:hypothetical protein